jgi:NADH-quinone oxidoreductase subunit M
MSHFPYLSLIIFLPLVGSFFVLAAWRRPQVCRWITILVASLDLALVVGIFFMDLSRHAGPTGNWLLVEDLPWIDTLGIRYSLGLDGVSLMLILLTAVLMLLCVPVSWKHVDHRVASFHFFLLFMETGVLGVFLATDLFLFYLFWEVQLIPMFFLVGIWGHEERIHATVKFILFTMAGGLLMLLAIIGLSLAHKGQTGVQTFALVQLMQTKLPRSLEFLLYAGFMLAFAVKVPMIPVHTWLPDAHTQAPTAGSVILAGLLLKTGTYALFRFAFPLFPEATKFSAPLWLGLGLGALFYTAWIALSQRDMKRLVAYSSVAHMGLVIIGLAIWNVVTLSGALLQMINHGLSTSALFILVGMIDERVHSRQLGDLGGLWKGMPILSAFFLFFAMSSLGLPGLNNFVGELLILVGTFKANPLVSILGFLGLVFTLVYVLRLVQDTLFGKAKKEYALWDATPREIFVLAALGLPVLFIGLYPGPVLEWFQEPIRNVLQHTVLLAQQGM